MAIVGPSGCGKTTLLRTIAGLNVESEGSLIWNGENLSEEGDFDPSEIGYVPQFSIAYDELTVDESIEAVTRLQVKTHGIADLDARIDRVLEVTGLAPIADRPVKVLSGGQKRRLGLAMELVSDPTLLLCDEVTSGLDPRSERDIVRLLHKLSRSDGRVIISVTHSLAHLELYDSILVLHEGRVAYHGPPSQLTHYFSVDDTEEIYPRLAKQKSSVWQSSWLKHQEAYYDKLARYRDKKIAGGEIQLPALLSHTTGMLTSPDSKKLDQTGELDLKENSLSSKDEKLEVASAPLEDDSGADNDIIPLDDAELKKEKAAEREKREKREKDVAAKKINKRINEEEDEDEDDLVREEAIGVEMPGLVSQYLTLLGRRWKIFFRDKGQVFLQVAILLCFPCLVVLFADQGDAANLKNYASSAGASMGELRDHIKHTKEVTENRAAIGGAISGIIMFQVVLLALMGSNNAAREIAGEREIWEKEKFSGVRPLAYIGAKVTFLACLVLIQSFWMAFFVNEWWDFPKETGSSGFLSHMLFMVLVNGAMTAICLGISALMKTQEQASLLSIYLVGFQLPLSGAVLALPEVVGQITRPFISAYWAWSGSIRSLPDNEYQAISAINSTPFKAYELCLYMLIGQIAVGLIAAYIGSKRHRWEH